MFSKELAKKNKKKTPTKQTNKTIQIRGEKNNNLQTMRGQLHTTSLNF